MGAITEKSLLSERGGDIGKLQEGLHVIVQSGEFPPAKGYPGLLDYM
jgi:hypothetical protein